MATRHPRGNTMVGRLVVTGHDSAGRSVFVQDEKLKRIDRPGVGYSFRFWSANEPALYPSPGKNPRAPEFFPPVGGVRFFTTTLTPQGGRPASIQADPAGSSSEMGTGVAVMERDAPGMHSSDSTDFALVISGQVALELDDGAEVVLSAGDAVVQNGTRHRWRALGEEPATLAFVIVGAHRAQSK